MSRKPAGVLLAIIMVSTGILPALAGETRLPDSGASAPAASDSTPVKPELRTMPAAPSAPTASTEASGVPGGKKHRCGLLASTAGALVEAPSAMCRQTARELDIGVDDLTHDSDNPILRVPATLISLPFCVFAGCVEGTIYAIRYRHNDDAAPANMKKAEPPDQE